MTDQGLAVVVLAAGKGTRMHSDKPKVLHSLLGETMLWYVLDAMRSVAQDQVWTVIGHRADLVRALFPGERFVLQEEQLGTGHAVQCAWPEMLQAGAKWCLVVNGDTPLVDAAIVQRFCKTMIQDQVDVGFMTLELSDPQSYGRVVRDGSGRIAGIVEAKDFDAARHGQPSGEVNAGIYLLRAEAVQGLLSSLSADNQQQEYYLTQLVDLAARQGLRVAAMDAGDAGDTAAFMGVNSPAELAASEGELQQRLIAKWLGRGVMVHFPAMVRIGPRVILEPGAELFGPCELYGQTVVAAGAVIESHTWIRHSRIGSGSLVRPFSHLEGAVLQEDCVVGPFARLRPGAELEREARVGNFVEMKKARLGARAKANHLTYLGDAEVGTGANIGAGTITCNYDGRNKHLTSIGAGAFIGSNTALVAPVRIGDHALVGAGSVITKDVADNVLAVARCRQRVFPKRREE
jgi:bifunctional UDP-N-acetylglucosamine pyrophosphorylase / glucosamine-1-phosphate N-acetyltransferase